MDLHPCEKEELYVASFTVGESADQLFLPRRESRFQEHSLRAANLLSETSLRDIDLQISFRRTPARISLS